MLFRFRVRRSFFFLCNTDSFQGNIERGHIADKVSRNSVLPRRFLHDVMVYVTFTFRNVSPLFGVCPSSTYSSNAVFGKLALLSSSGAGNELLCWTLFEPDDGNRVGITRGRVAIIRGRWIKCKKNITFTLYSFRVHKTGVETSDLNGSCMFGCIVQRWDLYVEVYCTEMGLVC